MFSRKSQAVHDAPQEDKSVGEVYGRLREALFSYSMKLREKRGTGASGEAGILTAKEIRMCNMATD